MFLFVVQGGNIKQELKHEPVSTRVKLKILPHLLRSRLAAECFPANIQVISTLSAFRKSVTVFALVFIFSVRCNNVFTDLLFAAGCLWRSLWSQHQQQTVVSHITVCPSYLHGVRQLCFIPEHLTCFLPFKKKIKANGCFCPTVAPTPTSL